MSRLQLIEQKLQAIDGAGFQNLCDAYLTRRTQEIRSLNRTGSQFGKQKTVKGTPDTFFRLEDGRLQFVEFTTQADDILKKIKEDLDKCVDESKIGIPKEDVDKVIFCFNSRLTVEQERELVLYARDKGVDIDLLGIDNIAMEINSKHLILARDFLDIPLDTGQILSLPDFIQEYNNKAGGLATPLDNEFFHRKDELSDIGTRLETADLLVISGAPGVGKTKIALEAISQFLDGNKHYQAFAVSKKDVDISADLRIHLDNDKDYILLVDDANRQLVNFKQILGVFKEKRVGNIKLVVTVRDYAIADIINECLEYKHEKIELQRFTDDETKAIIASDAFEIRHHKYQDKIVEIADGNARLAIMGARLAIAKQQDFLYGSVFELYDSYFQTFVKDNDIFKDDTTLQTLGIISFFFTIHRGDKAFIQNMLTLFGLDYYKFNDAINELEKRELLEIKYDHVRVSEQVIATYYFYKVFIKDKSLPFKTLLFNYFPKWKNRFTDTVVPANNTFGYKEVRENINGDLDAYLLSLTSDDEHYTFFSMFWFYKSDEMLTFLHAKIKAIPEPVENSVYKTDYKDNDYSYHKDQIISYLSRLFVHNTEYFLPALELAFEYIRKLPKHLPELIKNLRDKISFEHDDEMVDFARQIGLFNHVIENLTYEYYKQAFFALASTFLAHHYQVHRSARGNKITMYNYPIPATDSIKQFRIKIWEALFRLFPVYPEKVLDVLSSFSQPRMTSLNEEILEADLDCIIPFIDSQLEPSIFTHMHFVQEFIKRIKSSKYSSHFQKLKLQFRNEDYLAYRVLDWNYFRGKHEYDFDDHKEFERLKEADIRATFLFKNAEDFEKLHSVIRNFQSVENDGKWGLHRSIDIVLQENFDKNPTLGLALFQSYLDNYTGINYTPVGLFNAIIKRSQSDAAWLWATLNKWEHTEKPHWLMYYIYALPKEYITNEHIEAIRKIITDVESTNFMIHLDALDGYFTYHKALLIELAQLILDKNNAIGNKIMLGRDFFEKYSQHFKGYEPLLSATYIQQEKCQHLHDYDRKDFAEIVKLYPPVLLEFISEFYTKERRYDREDRDRKLAFVWDIEGGLDSIEKAFDMITEKNTYLGILDYPLVVFFKGLSASQMEKAKDFLFYYIENHKNDEHRINAIFNTIHDAKIPLFEPALLHYLSCNTDVVQFENIDWVANPGVISGDQLFGEIEAHGWENVLAIVDKHPNKLDLIPIKAYIKRKIQSSHERAEDERKRKFIDPRNWG